MLPILLIYIGQAFLSRAHANWAAAGYVAATVLVTATMLREDASRWFKGSLWLHGVLAVIIAFAPVFAGRFISNGALDPFSRLIGWRGLADAVRNEAGKARSTGNGYAVILIDDRATLAEHLYYLRDLDVPIRAWKSGPVAKDHYELTRPFEGSAGPVLLVLSNAREPKAILARFDKAEKIVDRPRGEGQDWRPLTLYRLEGFKK